MTEQTINELTNFFKTFQQGETKQPTQSNLLFDDAVAYFLGIWKNEGWLYQLWTFIKTTSIQKFSIFNLQILFIIYLIF